MDNNTDTKIASDKLWELCKKLWDIAENREEIIKEREDYFNGQIKKPAFDDQPLSNCNICKQITETKLHYMLDGKYTLGVTPVYKTYATATDIKAQQFVSSVFTAILKDVLKMNKIDSLNEESGRHGLVAGLGAGQVIWDTEDDVQGQILIKIVDPKMIRWDKCAVDFKEITYVAYQIQMPPAVIKRRYAKNPDGTYNKELCDAIDAITDTKGMEKDKRTYKPSIAIGSTQYGANYMNVYDKTANIQANKVVKLIVMFTLDGSLAPSKNDDTQDTEVKTNNAEMFPNGRRIIFSLNQEKKLIFEDDPLPDGFRSLGNMSFFTPGKYNDIIGKGEIYDIIPIQDRINGTYAAIRKRMADDISTICIKKELLGDADFVNFGVTKLEAMKPDDMPQVIKTNNVADVQGLLDYVERLKNEARETARLNETVMFGDRQVGTTSAEQVDALNESPMSSVRALQRQFREFLVDMGEKIIGLALKYYNTQRIIEVSIGSQSKMVEVNSVIDNATGEQVLVIKVDNEQIIVDKNWKFKVDVQCGADVPRSRLESANLLDKMFTNGMLGDPQDIDTKEAFMRDNDIPNYRLYIDMQRSKQDEAAKNPPKPTLVDLIMDEKKAKAVSDLMTSMKGFSKAQGQILEALGMNGGTDTIQDAPAQELTNKGDLKDLAAIVPSKVSLDPEKNAATQGAATAVIDVKEGK